MITRFDGVSLWSSDLQNLLPFHRDTMGLPVALESPRFVILGDLDLPKLCIGSHSDVRGRSPDRHRWLVQLQSDDMQADVARLKAAGVAFMEDPNDQGGGHWLATCEDPEGNLVQLNYWEPGARERRSQEHAEASRAASA